MPVPALVDSLAATIARSPMFQTVITLITENPVFKFCFAVLVAILGNAEAEQQIYLALIITGAVDVLLGIWRAFKTDTFDIRKVTDFVPKWVVYFAFLILGHQAGIITHIFSRATEFAAAFIWIKEYDSCAKNVRAISNFRPPRISTLITFGGSFLSRIIGLDKKKK